MQNVTDVHIGNVGCSLDLPSADGQCAHEDLDESAVTRVIQ